MVRRLFPGGRWIRTIGSGREGLRFEPYVCRLMSFLFRRAAARRGGRAPDEVAGSCRAARVLVESDADPVAVPPGSITQNCELTIKEGMLNETTLQW